EQRLGRVARQHRHAFLRDDRAGVEIRRDDVHGRAGLSHTGREGALDGVHSAREGREQRRVDVDDPAAEGVEQWRGVDAVVAGVDDELDAVREEEVAHGGVTLIDGSKRSLRQLAERNAALASESRAAARRPVRGHGDDVEAALDQVAKVRTAAGHADSDPHRKMTRSGPSCSTTWPTTSMPERMSLGSMTAIMPRPMLKVRSISSSAIR